MVSTFDATNAAIAHFGRIVDAGSYKQLIAGSEYVFVANCTDCTLAVYGGTTDTTFEYAVDGGSLQPVTLPVANANTTFSPLSGASAGDHLVRLKLTQNGVGYVVISGFITLSGGAGTIRLPGTAEGYGPYQTFGSGANYIDPGSWQVSGGGSGQYASPPNYLNTNAPGNGGYSDCRSRVLGNPETLKLWAFQAGQSMAWFQDGVKKGTFVLPNTSEWGFYTVTTGLDSTQHEYWAQSIIQPESNYIDAFMLVGSGAAFSTQPLPALAGLGGFGDSITAGSIGTSGDSTLSWLNLLAVQLGRMPFNRGISGNAFSGGAGPNFQDRTGDITDISPELPDVIGLMGTNDLSAAGDGSSPSSGFGSDYQSTLNQLLSGTVATKFYVVGILPRMGFSSATLTAWNGSGNGVQGSIASVIAATPEYASRLTYVDPVPWQLNGPSGTDYTTNYLEGLHPNDAGCVIIKNGLLPLFVSPSTTILPCFLGRFGMFSGILSSVAVSPSLYFRPDGTSKYLRPDGTSLYQRP